MVTKRFSPKIFLERAGEGRKVTGYKTGQIIFTQGTPAEHVYYLQLGVAKETVTTERGKQAVVNMIEPGSFFGMNSLDGIPLRYSTTTTIAPCVVTEISATAMWDALLVPTFAQLFLRHLVGHNSRVEAEKIALLFNTIEKRLAQKLLILAHFGDGPARKIGPEVTQEMLAEMIGSTRTHVNHFLNKFRRLGFIKYNGGITVLPGLLDALLDGKKRSTANV